MENFKFTLFAIFILALLGFSGYWAFTTIESGSTHVDAQKQKELEQTNEDLTKELTQIKKEMDLLQEEQLQKEQEALVNTTPKTPVAPSTPTKPAVSKNQSLIDELQKLVDGKIYLKNKSQGPAVGTLQKFFNIYNNTSLKVDNDYGVSVATAVKAFQKAQGLTQDGEAGPGTFLKMINWIKSH